MQSSLEVSNTTATNGSPNNSKESSLRPLTPDQETNPNSSTKENGINGISNGTKNGNKSDSTDDPSLDSVMPQSQNGEDSNSSSSSSKEVIAITKDHHSDNKENLHDPKDNNENANSNFHDQNKSFNPSKSEDFMSQPPPQQQIQQQTTPIFEPQQQQQHGGQQQTQQDFKFGGMEYSAPQGYRNGMQNHNNWEESTMNINDYKRDFAYLKFDSEPKKALKNKRTGNYQKM